METASTDHVSNTVVGFTVGAIATGVALAVAGPVLAPIAAGAALIGITAPLTVLGGGLGAWIGYNRAEAKAARYGFRGKQ
jgi:hypothetical protein